MYDSSSWFLVNGSKPQKPAWVLTAEASFGSLSRVDSCLCSFWQTEEKIAILWRLLVAER